MRKIAFIAAILFFTPPILGLLSALLYGNYLMLTAVLSHFTLDGSFGFSIFMAFVDAGIGWISYSVFDSTFEDEREMDRNRMAREALNTYLRIKPNPEEER